MTYSLHVALVVEDCDLHLGLLALDHVVREVQGDEERFEHTKLEKINKNVIYGNAQGDARDVFFRFHFLESGQNNMLGLEPPTV